MEKEEYVVKRRELVRLMAQGQSYEAASTKVEPPIGKVMARRLVRRYQEQGEAALSEGRGGHPSKFRSEVQEWLKQSCSQHPTVSGRQLQKLILANFELVVSVSQINRVRTALQLPRPSVTSHLPGEDGKVFKKNRVSSGNGKQEQGD